MQKNELLASMTSCDGRKEIDCASATFGGNNENHLAFAFLAL